MSAYRSLYGPALDLVAAHCDLEERLPRVPPTARVRGMFFKSVEAELDRGGKLPAYRRLFPRDRYYSIPYYPLTDYIIRVACAGAILNSPQDLHAGMFELARGNADAFMGSLLGRVMLRLHARDPIKVSEQGLAARRQSCAYGRWELVRHAPRHIEMVYHEEYQWIESIIAGAAHGTFAACGLTPTLKTMLVDPFNGSTHITW